MISVPLLLSIKDLFDKNLFIVLGIILAMSLYVLVTTPYQHRIDNWRLLIQIFLILFIIIIQVATKMILSSCFE